MKPGEKETVKVLTKKVGTHHALMPQGSSELTARTDRLTAHQFRAPCRAVYSPGVGSICVCTVCIVYV